MNTDMNTNSDDKLLIYTYIYYYPYGYVPIYSDTPKYDDMKFLYIATFCLGEALWNFIHDKFHVSCA